MSIYTYTACYDCKYFVFLGRVGRNEDLLERSYQGLYWGQDDAYGYHSETMTKLLWKFMADHRFHKLRFLDESHPDSDMIFGFISIDDDSTIDATLEEYMEEWPGLIEKPTVGPVGTNICIACRQCKLFLSLGEVIQQADGSGVYVKSPKVEAPYEKKAVHMALWKLLAEHMQHDIRVIDESSSDYKDTDTYWDIGNTQRKGITLIRYLEGWGG